MKSWHIHRDDVTGHELQLLGKNDGRDCIEKASEQKTWLQKCLVGESGEGQDKDLPLLLLP